jgi:hypothetical protein
MRARASSLLLGPRPSRLLGVVVAAVGVAAITALILPLRQVSPAIANGVLYLLHAPPSERILGPTTRYLLDHRPCRVVVETDPARTVEPAPAAAVAVAG